MKLYINHHWTSVRGLRSLLRSRRYLLLIRVFLDEVRTQSVSVQLCCLVTFRNLSSVVSDFSVPPVFQDPRSFKLCHSHLLFS